MEGSMIRLDCRYFPGDRPCDFHKQGLATCRDCPHYASRGTTILIIKLEALGDVLRTTSILPALRRQYDPCHVTWITSNAARELFTGNDLVDRVISAPDECLPALLSRTFDVVINPDAAVRSCELAAVSKSHTAFGYRLGPEGAVLALNRAAGRWLEMGGSDVLKRSNTMTYQQMLHDICALDPTGQHIVLNLTEEESAEREALARETGVDPDRPVVGLNTGAGRRWRLKKWRTEGFIDLIEMILGKSDAQVVLLGGELESDRNAYIASRFNERVMNPRLESIRRLVRTIDLCDTVVTGDTLALHAALGLRKRVVAVFGPTSPAEIDMYGLGTKVIPDIDCVCCYRTDCDREPSCMDLITADDVYRYLVEEMKVAVAGRESNMAIQAGAARSQGDECMVGEPIADW
jgi:ADP-heptose:LPS heptosyltransferase